VGASALLFLALAALGAGPADTCATTPARIADVHTSDVQAGDVQTGDALLDVAAAEAVSPALGLPGYCRVRGVIGPSIGFEARLPLSGWNGKYYQTGCGGFCGAVLPDKGGRSNAINHALKRGYAVITTDGGHEGAHIGDARWARDNPQAEALFAHRAIALTYRAGRALVRAFYGEDPDYAYFSGCSNGGRMALIAAQRYPALFDGIVSGCPVVDLAGSGGVFGAWVLQANQDPRAESGRILDASFRGKLAYLEGLVEAQCDGLDGSLDGLIAAPDRCAVDLDRAASCEGRSEAGAAGGGAAPPCLSDAEKRAVAAWYRGPHDSAGARLFSGMPPGSERFWGVWYLGDENGPGPGMLLADGYGRYMAFPEDPEDYAPEDFDFDRDVAGLAAQGALYNATDPDLRAFRDAGGKLLLWHGMADPLVVPQQSIDYYRSVIAKIGGVRETQAFFRMFLAPGVGHCWEAPGAGPDDFDPLAALEVWVEDGVAPDVIEAAPSPAQAGLTVSGVSYRPYPAEPVIHHDQPAGEGARP